MGDPFDPHPDRTCSAAYVVVVIVASAAACAFAGGAIAAHLFTRITGGAP